MKDRKRCLLKRLRLNDRRSALSLFVFTGPLWFEVYPSSVREYNSISNDCTLLKSPITGIDGAVAHYIYAFELHC
jgi:hypothetical protein